MVEIAEKPGESNPYFRWQAFTRTLKPLIRRRNLNGSGNTSRAFILLSLIVVSVLMLVPTVVSIGDIGGGIEGLPKRYIKIFSKKMNLTDLQGGIHSVQGTGRQSTR